MYAAQLKTNMVIPLLQVPVESLRNSGALPAALWVEVLQHAHQQQQLGQLALVCKAWALAATQATVHVQRELPPGSMPALQSWLDAHAGQLLSLKVSLSCAEQHMQVLQLPLSKLTKLQHLQLKGFKLQLGKTLTSVTMLRRLRFLACSICSCQAFGLPA
jgi:hypothetical protein